MPKVVHRPFCTIYKRSESEKRVYNMTKEFDEMKKEMQSLREKVEQQESDSKK